MMLFYIFVLLDILPLATTKSYTRPPLYITPTNLLVLIGNAVHLVSYKVVLGWSRNLPNQTYHDSAI